MQRLLLFLGRYKALLFFILLEVLCVWLIVKNNNYQGAAYFSSASRFTGNILNISSSVKDYFILKKVNRKLSRENSRLRDALQAHRSNISETATEASFAEPDSGQHFEYEAARIINNSVNRFNNFLTLDKGSADGIEPGMGVVGPDGIVGKVKACSPHFSTVISLLHSDMTVSSVIQGNGIFCTTKWDGKDYREAELLYVPRHEQVQKQDTVLTSGYNAVFPRNIMIGTVKSVEVPEGETFYDIRLQLAADFKRLTYAYVIKNELQQEKDSLEQASYENASRKQIP